MINDRAAVPCKLFSLLLFKKLDGTARYMGQLLRSYYAVNKKNRFCGTNQIRRKKKSSSIILVGLIKEISLWPWVPSFRIQAGSTSNMDRLRKDGIFVSYIGCTLLFMGSPSIFCPAALCYQTKSLIIFSTMDYLTEIP